MTANQRQTPLTDAAIRDYGYRGGDESGNWHKQMLVDPIFARQLEQDRAELMEALKALRDKMLELDSDLWDVFKFAAVHNYTWPADKNWKAEAENADALLARLESKSPPSASTPSTEPSSE